MPSAPSDVKECSKFAPVASLEWSERPHTY